MTTSHDYHHLLSVDPGAKSAWALWVRTSVGWWRLQRWGRLAKPGVVDIWQLLGELLETWEGAHLVVEGQWYLDPQSPAGRRAGAAHYRAVEKVVESRCAWRDAALLAGATASIAAPGTWIPAVSKNAPGDTPDERARWVVGRRLPAKLSLDEAAAVGMGAWWIVRHDARIDWSRPEEAA